MLNVPRKKSGKKPPATAEARIGSEKSSGNVFADLGLPNPELLQAKSRLIMRIEQLLEDRKLSQAQAGKLFGIDQPKVSALLQGKTAGYSLDRLFRFLNALGQQVEIVVRPADPAAGPILTVK